MPNEESFRSAIIEWYSHDGRTFPWRDSTDPYEVLIGEVLLQRTRGENAVPVYVEFLRKWPNLEKLARARVATIEKVIRPLGLIRRAGLIKKLGVALHEGGGVPGQVSDLAELPGVGRYAAHAVPIFAHGANLGLVDWVIARVLRRFFGLPTGKRPNADQVLWDLSARLAETVDARALWLGTLDFAASFCKRTPRCKTCMLRDDCDYFTSGGPATG